MALTDEQRTMLQLLLGGQSYDDIGGLLGVSTDDVRGRASAALSEMGGADADASLTDFLLGQADPIGRADAVRQLQNDPAANERATRIASQLRLLAPSAELPEIPAPKGGRRQAAPAPPPAAPAAPSAPSAAPSGRPKAEVRAPGESLPTRLTGAARGAVSGMDRRLGFALGAALVLVVVAVIALSGGDGGDPACPAPDTTAAEQAGFPVSALDAVEQPAEGECAATGQVVLSVTNQQAFMQTNATGLEATSGGDSYVLWLYRSDREATPLGRQAVDATGNLTGAAPLTTQEVALLPAYQSVRLSLVSQAEAEEVEQTLREQRKAPLAVTRFVGVPVLEGPVPQLDLGGGSGSGANGKGAGSKKK